MVVSEEYSLDAVRLIDGRAVEPTTDTAAVIDFHSYRRRKTSRQLELILSTLSELTQAELRALVRDLERAEYPCDRDSVPA